MEVKVNDRDPLVAGENADEDEASKANVMSWTAVKRMILLDTKNVDRRERVIIDTRYSLLVRCEKLA